MEQSPAAAPPLAQQLALDVVDMLCADGAGKGPRMLHPVARDQLATMLAGIVRARVPAVEPVASSDVVRAIGELRGTGLSELDELLSPEQVADIRRHLEPHQVYKNWVAHAGDRQLHTVEAASRLGQFGCYDERVILTTPHLLELAVHPWTQTLVEHYLGCPPTLTSLNVWWSFPGHKRVTLGDSQDFHRDTEAYRSCVVFVYLTDVTQSSGAHCYIRNSHSLPAVTAEFEANNVRLKRSELAQKMAYAPDMAGAFRGDALLWGDDRLIEPLDLFMLSSDGYGGFQAYQTIFKDRFSVIVGSAGTGFAVDTYGLHAGLPPTDGPRLCAWIRFAIDPSYPSAPEDPELAAAVFDSRIADTARNRFILRNVLTRRA